MPGYREHLADLPPTYNETYGRVPAGRADFDRRAAQLDKAATAFLKGKGGRWNPPTDDREARRQYRREGRAAMAVGRTLARPGGSLRPSARVHGPAPSGRV